MLILSLTLIVTNKVIKICTCKRGDVFGSLITTMTADIIVNSHFANNCRKVN